MAMTTDIHVGGQAEYTTRQYPHGTAIFGTIPVSDLSALTKLCGKRGEKFIAPGIASAIGACLVFGTKDGIDKWMAELAKSGDWLRSGDTGISSRVIYMAMRGAFVTPTDVDVPHDPSDFGRCYRLLKRFPEWVDRLPELAVKFPLWAPMVREWSRMTALYERDLPTGRCDELYELMKTLEDEGRALAKVGK